MRPTDRPPREGDGEVRGDGRLADAALAAGHGDHAGESAGTEGHLPALAAAQPLGESLPLLR
jgi:hypothetical protein